MNLKNGKIHDRTEKRFLESSDIFGVLENDREDTIFEDEKKFKKNVPIYSILCVPLG